MSLTSNSFAVSALPSVEEDQMTYELLMTGNRYDAELPDMAPVGTTTI